MLNCCPTRIADDDAIFFKLGCRNLHSVCVRCFSNANAERCCNPYIICPQCKTCVTEWELVSLGGDARDGDSRDQFFATETSRGNFLISPPTLDHDPKQFHKSMDNSNEVAVLSITIPDDTGKITTVAAVIDKDKEPRESDVRRLTAIFQYLNTFLVQQEDTGEDDIEAYLVPSKVFANTTNDPDPSKCSILHRCIHALATGDLIGNEQNMTTRWLNLRAASFAATDIIRNLKSGAAGRLKRIISRQLLANGVSQGVWKILTKFGIAPSVETERLRTIEQVHGEIMKGLPVSDPHDLWLMLYDNIGFRIRKGYEQYTAIQWVRIAKEKLQEWGVYPTEGKVMTDCPFTGRGHPLAGKSYIELRVRKDWAQVRENVNFEDVIGVGNEDVKRLADSTFGTIHQLLAIFSDLPTKEEAILLVQNAGEVKWNREYTATDDRDTDDTEDGVDRSEAVTYGSAVNEDEVEDPKDAHIDRPMKRDLNSKSTCKVLLDYCLEMRDTVISKDAEDGWEAIPKIMEEVPLPVCGDGNPTFLISTLMKETPEKYSRKVVGYSGGFHMLLEAHRKRGDAFGQTHLEDIFSCWRPTEGQLRWVLNPGDPNQINAELIMYVLGMYAAAIRSALIGKANSAANDAEIQLSAKEVVDHMLARAKEWPIVMMVLIELRFAELTFMLKESQRNGGDVDLYHTATKFLSRLYAGTHCTKYTHLITELFVDWYCSSDSEKVIFAKGIFTRKTKNGETIFTVSQ